MQKQAAPDPRFKAVKQHKKNWNKAMKELISRMIAFKRALNGTGDQKYALPASKLQQPIPSELTNFINTLSSNYEAVAADALKIMQEQNDFATNRATPAQKEASLKVEASSFLSRFMAYLKSPFLSDDNKRTRISLLRGMAGLEKLLEKFENEILSRKTSEATQTLRTIREKFDLLYGSFDSLVSLEQNAPSSVENINTGDLDKLMDSLKSVIHDMSLADQVPNIESPHLISLFNSQLVKLNKESNLEKKKELAIESIQIYNRALRAANIINKQTAKSFRELLELTKGNKAVAEISAVASNLVSRWLKKKTLNPFKETSSIIVTLQEVSESTREIIDELMNSLQQELDVKQTQTSLYQLYTNFEIMEKNLLNIKAPNEKSNLKNKK